METGLRSRLDPPLQVLRRKLTRWGHPIVHALEVFLVVSVPLGLASAAFAAATAAPFIPMGFRNGMIRMGIPTRAVGG